MDNMKKQVSYTKHILYRVTIIFLLIFILISCEPFTTAPSQKTEETITKNPTTDTALTQNIEPKTPPALPAIYQSPYLNPLDTPHTYIEETCQAIRKRWDPLSAEPGTVVMIIMFHDILRGPVDTMDGMNVFNFDKIMLKLKEQGFKAINTKQFLAFMERNVKIPPRSVLIIQDGNYNAENFDKNFREYWETWDWPVVNGWVSEPDMPESIWEENIALEREGWVDHQAQGVITWYRLIGRFVQSRYHTRIGRLSFRFCRSIRQDSLSPSFGLAADLACVRYRRLVNWAINLVSHPTRADL